MCCGASGQITLREHDHGQVFVVVQTDMIHVFVVVQVDMIHMFVVVQA